MKNSTSWDKSKRVCTFCNDYYHPITKWQKYCSKEHQWQDANSKKKRGITNFGKCLRCDKDLSNKRAQAIYCSKTCKCMDHNFKQRQGSRTHSVARRALIWKRDSSKCYICGKEIELKQMEIDHLIPVSRGGCSDEKNLASSCRFCNRSRGSKIGKAQLIKLFELRQDFDN